MRISNLLFVAVLWAGAVLGASQAAVAQEPIEATYNRGVSLYRDGKIAEAAEQFQLAAAAANREVASKARFNLGNTHYARALQAIENTQQPNQVAAIESLERAIASYRSALRTDPTDTDARANIELASQLIKQLNQQQQQQSQQQQNQDQQQQSDQKQQDQQQSGEEQQDPPQQSDEEQQDQQPQDQQPQDQPQSDPQPQESQQDPTAEPQASDQADSESPDRRKPQQADSPEEVDSDEPKETPKGQLSAADEGDEEQRTMAQSVPPQDGQQMTEEEVRKMLQAIRDRDMLRRLRRQAAERSRRIPVERDW